MDQYSNREYRTSVGSSLSTFPTVLMYARSISPQTQISTPESVVFQYKERNARSIADHPLCKRNIRPVMVRMRPKSDGVDDEEWEGVVVAVGGGLIVNNVVARSTLR